jgi:hypothetical protein
MVEEKNAANLGATRASCLMEWQSSTIAAHFKPINVYTLEAPTTTTPKVTPPRKWSIFIFYGYFVSSEKTHGG